jgi:hypothetical protein
MDWFLERLEQTDPTLDYFDLGYHPDDFNTLLALKLLKHERNADRIPCDLCAEDHLAPVFTNTQGELVISCAGSRRTVNPDELKIWTINKDALAKNVRSRNPVIDKNSFEHSAFAAKKQSASGKYSDEPIPLKAIGLEIRGSYIWRGSVKTAATLTDTDRRLAHLLYSKYRRNCEECSTLTQLATEPFDEGDDMAEGYIANRIVEINKVTKEALAIKGKTSIRSLITHERDRGYRLNPKIMEVGSK